MQLQLVENSMGEFGEDERVSSQATLPHRRFYSSPYDFGGKRTRRFRPAQESAGRRLEEFASSKPHTGHGKRE